MGHNGALRPGALITFRFPERLSVDAWRPGSVFPTTFRYSLISLVELAREARILQTRQIAARFELSPHYLSGVLRELRRLGLVESVKGNRGGSRSPADAWLQNLAERWGRDLEAVSLVDLCSEPGS